MSKSEIYFKPFREQIIGSDVSFDTPYGLKKMIYADWAASGRLYQPIENKMQQEIGPYVANTHTETNFSGSIMTQAYFKAQHIIKEHVNAGPKDIILTTGSGMTRVVNKFQRILGLKLPEKLRKYVSTPEELRPVIFVTHMEHHSNHTSWMETIGDVVCIEPDEQGMVDLTDLDRLLHKYEERKIKIAAVSAGSNVTGLQPPYHEIAKRMHKQGGLCFVDFAYSAPYVKIDMHPSNEAERLDAIYFSPHKMLGGPGSAAVLVFDSDLYKNKTPDNPGGGTVKWTNPWGEYSFFDNIEIREDGGTPAFLQTMKSALSIRLKEKMGIHAMLEREKELVKLLFTGLKNIPGLHILAGHLEDRLGVISFYIDGLHYNLGVKLLNDLFGIEVRGGCSCAGTYGHYLLHVSPDYSHKITEKIDHGDFSEKPGWIRLSVHPVMTEAEINYIIDAIDNIAKHHTSWIKDYRYNSHSNEFKHHSESSLKKMVDPWFKF